MSLLDVRNLSVTYGAFSLKDVSFSCDAGEIVALVGKNGAGKTTTIDSLVGLTNRNGGSVTFDGEEITEKNIHLFKQRVGYVSGVAEYYPNAKISDLLKVVSSLYHRWDAGRMQEYLKAFDIDEKKKLSELSTGTKVKLSLAMAFSHAAEILLLDEPTTGLDPIVREHILAILQRLSRETGTGVLFSSHITQDIEKIASRVMFMVDGRIACDVKVAELAWKYVKIRRKDFEALDEAEQVRAIMLSNGDCVVAKDDPCYTAVMDAVGTAPTIEEVLIYLNGGLQ